MLGLRAAHQPAHRGGDRVGPLKGLSLIELTRAPASRRRCRPATPAGRRASARPARARRPALPRRAARTWTSSVAGASGSSSARHSTAYSGCSSLALAASWSREIVRKAMPSTDRTGSAFGVVGVQLERRRPGQRQPHAHGGGRLAVQADAREGERQRQPAGLLLVEQRERRAARRRRARGARRTCPRCRRRARPRRTARRRGATGPRRPGTRGRSGSPAPRGRRRARRRRAARCPPAARPRRAQARPPARRPARRLRRAGWARRPCRCGSSAGGGRPRRGR